MTPATIYLGTQQQPVPYAQYNTWPIPVMQSYPPLWIQGVGSWTQYVTVPQGATVPLIAVSPTGGNGYLGEIINGMTYNSNYYFYPTNLLCRHDRAAHTIRQHKRPVKQPSDNKCDS